MGINIKSEKAKQWLWFIGLWGASLGVTLSIAYVIKLFIKMI